MSNKAMNMTVLVQLADAQIEKTVADYGGLPLDIRESMEELATKRKKDASAAAAQEILNLFDDTDDFIRIQATARAGLVKQIEAIDGLLAEVSRARAYGNATRNYIPLAKQIGKVVAGASSELGKLPKDWTPPAAEAAPAAQAATPAGQ